MKFKLALLALAGAATIVGAAPAYADESSFVRDLAAAGFADTDGSSMMVAAGYDVCGQLRGGATPLSVVKELYTASKLTDSASAEQFVDIAIRDLCPTATQA